MGDGTLQLLAIQRERKTLCQPVVFIAYRSQPPGVIVYALAVRVAQVRCVCDTHQHDSSGLYSPRIVCSLFKLVRASDNSNLPVSTMIALSVAIATTARNPLDLFYRGCSCTHWLLRSWPTQTYSKPAQHLNPLGEV